MTRAPFFIRQLREDPSEPASFPYNAFSKQKSKQFADSIFKGGKPLSVADINKLSSNLALTNLINQGHVRDERTRILNISNNLDSVRTYGWQAEFYERNQLPLEYSEDYKIGDTVFPRLTLALKSIEFPNYTQAKTDFTTFNSLISHYTPTFEKLFKLTFLDLLEGGDILNFLFDNKYLSIDDPKVPAIPAIYIKKYDTEGEVAGGMVFANCQLYGLKLGNLDYQIAGGMLEHTVDVRWDTWITLNREGVSKYPSYYDVQDAFNILYKENPEIKEESQSEQTGPRTIKPTRGPSPTIS